MIGDAALRLSNCRPSDLLLWLEPWCDEVTLPPRAELTLVIEGNGPAPEIEQIEDHLVLYAGGGTRLRVYVNGIEQDTASSLIAVPDSPELSTRESVRLLFGGFPAARPGGVPLPPRRRRGLFSRLFGRSEP